MKSRQSGIVVFYFLSKLNFNPIRISEQRISNIIH